MNHVYIHSPPCWLARVVRRCTTCKCRRRFVVRLYEYYGSRWACGGCGHEFASEEGRTYSSKQDRERRRAFVRESWPTAKTMADAICEMLSSTTKE